MTLGEQLERMISSDRIIVQTEEKEELYRGYVANFEHSEVDRDREVGKIGVATDIFRVTDRDRLLKNREKIDTKEDEISDFKFSDLELMIYIRIVIGKKIR